MNMRLGCLLAFLLTTSSSAFSADKPALDFAKHVQPILSAKCAKCHGPAKKSGGIAFDTRERAVATSESGEPAIVPGKPEASELIKRVTSHEEETRMPPEGKPLTSHEVEILTQWIREGANWSKHWAFRPLARPTVPTVQNKAWVKNEIDAFILHDLEEAKLTPTHIADKTALIRRAYYNLIGLPPTPAEVEAFVNDKSPDAWEKLIDKLLASEHYGEQWGRKWLDVVRYAETNSFERDNPKPHVWRYRDYVIRSFNDDKPYDRFIKEQLAGDELPDASPEDIIATGFYRLGVWDDEPADRELAMYDGFDDLVTTIGQGMLGLTLNCARCHDHKIDPVPQTDYYKMVAFLRNITSMQTEGPNIERPIYTSAQSRADYELREQKRKREAGRIQTEVSQLEREFAEKLAATERAAVEVRDLDDLEFKFYRDTWDKLPTFDELKPETIGKVKSGLFDITLATRDKSIGFVFTGFLKTPADGEYTFHLDSDDGSRLIVDGKQVLEFDGIHGMNPERTAKVQLKQGRVPVRLEYFQANHGWGLSVAWSGPGFSRRRLSKMKGDADTAKLEAAKEIKLRGRELLGDEKFTRYEQAKKQLEELKREVPAEKALAVKENGGHAADVFVLLRGTPGNHGAKVEPGFPAIYELADPAIPKPAKDAVSTGRRKVLADWIASPENLLTARVFVNRVWQGHFGRGIVRSPNNFGGLGTPPTHPELLDWLASDFVAGGWKLKRLHKAIMMSSAYQMASTGNPAALAKDPANDLFWRYDMRRLSAEEVRDSMLAVNGTLNLAMHGPSVYPEIQAEVLAGQSVPGKGWGKPSPENELRRAVYIHVKRSLITPLLASFDFPEPDVTCEARFTTTQPGQSFALLNGKFANEQAAVFAQRIKKEAGDDLTAQIQLATKLVTSRPASDAAVSRARDYIERLEAKQKLSREQAMQQYSLLMLNLNEFIYLD